MMPGRWPVDVAPQRDGTGNSHRTGWGSLMQAAQKKLSLANQLTQWFGGILRREGRKNSEAALNAALQEGLDSGVSNRSFEEIWDEPVRNYLAETGRKDGDG